MPLVISLRLQLPSYAFEFQKAHLRRVLRAAGNEVAALARANIRRSAGGGRLYRGSGGSKYRPYKPGHYTASGPGEAPVSVTGVLAGSIRVRPFRDGDGVAIRDTAFYSLFLEAGAQGGAGSGKAGVKGKRNKRGGKAGTRVLAPRPFLTAALDARYASLGARVQAAVLADVAFKKLKA